MGAAHSVCDGSIIFSAIVLSILAFSNSQVLGPPGMVRVYMYCVRLERLDVVLCNGDSAKVALPHGLELRQHVVEWFLVNMILPGYCDFFALVLFQSSGSAQCPVFLRTC